MDDKECKMEDLQKQQLDKRDLLRASTLIQDAVASRNFEFKQDGSSIRSYIMFNHPAFKAALYICLWGNMLLALFEQPSLSTLTLPYWITMIIEAAFMAFFSLRLGHGAHFQEAIKYWRDPKNLTVLFTIILTVTDMICYCVWINKTSAPVSAQAVRWSRPLRPLLLINFPEGRQLRKAFRNIRRTLPDIAHVLILFISSILLFALIAYKLFHQRELTYPNGEPYFQNYWDGFWDLYVLVTTANNPDVMMPAYDSNNWYVLLFVVYLLVNLYVFMNIVLAVIYNNYKKHLKDEVQTTINHKRQLLSTAFHILKTSQGGKEVVTKETWLTLMAKVAPKKTNPMYHLLFSVLDTRGEDCIEREDFLKVSDLLNIELKVTGEKGSCFARCCPPCYVSKWSEMLKLGISTRYFRWAFDALTFINAICIGLDLEVAEWFFLAAFTCEILLQLYARGPYKYFTAAWNIFDFVVIFAAMLGTAVESALGDGVSQTSAIDFLMMLRILRLVRLAGSFERFKVILVTVVNIGPSIATYGAVIFVVFYFYAVIGMEIFHDRIDFYSYNTSNETLLYCGNPLLNGSEFVTKQYCSNNFNSVMHAFVVLFDLLVVNQWHVLADGFVRVTHKAARLYFITFHVICVIILLNIFTAFVLEAFILEYTLSKSHLESIVETRIKELGLGVGQKPKVNFHKKSDRQDLVENMESQEGATHDDRDKNEITTENIDIGTGPAMDDCGLRFSLKKNTSKRLEVLLQLMFSDDGNSSDLSPGDSSSRQPTGAALQNIL